MTPAPDYGHNPHFVGNDQEIFEEEEESRPDRGKEIVDEVVVAIGGIPGVKKADFVEAGFSCTKCDWTTRKKGINGVQALRAHSKRHVRDRRATRNSHVLHTIVLAIGLIVAASPDLVLESLSTSWLGIYPVDFPVSGDIFGKMIATVSVTLGVTLLFISDRYVTTGRRKWSRTYKWLERIWITSFLLMASVMWTDIGRSVETLWMTSALLPWIASVLVRVSVAKTRIIVVRREFKPQRGRMLLRSKNYRTDRKINRYTQYLREEIQDGRIVLSKLKRRQVEYFRRLGLGGVQLDATLESKRLFTEQRDRQAKARERARLVRKHERERDGQVRRARRPRRPEKISCHSEQSTRTRPESRTSDLDLVDHP